MVPTKLPDELHLGASSADYVISQIRNNVLEAQDNLLQAKVSQEHYANSHHGAKFVYQVGDMVMLSTFDHRWEYHKAGEKRSAKFFPKMGWSLQNH
jgi:hypothetical protein